MIDKELEPKHRNEVGAPALRFQGGGAQIRTSDFLGGGSTPPSSNTDLLGGGSDPPSSNRDLLGGWELAPPPLKNITHLP